jgi:cadmium resistance protein CadD (predicted permease)
LSQEGGFGLSVLQRFLGFLLLILGALTLYYTLTSLPELGSYAALFGFLNIIVLVLGLVLLTAKTE